MGKRLLLCACACFLSSAILLSCKSEQVVCYSHKAKPVQRKTIIAVPLIVGEDTCQPQRSNNVTIIIKDSVLSRDSTLTAVKTIDTIQVNEPAREDKGEQETTVAMGEDAMPLTAEEMDTVISKYAEMINVERKELSNFNLYFFINHWYGTPYKWGGDDSSGIDCSAFTQKLYNKVFDVEIVRTAREQRRQCDRIKYPEDATEGDLLFFRIHHLRVSHVGVYLANGYFVHSSSSKGVVISNLNNKYWRRRFAGCGRLAHEDKSILESDNMQ